MPPSDWPSVQLSARVTVHDGAHPEVVNAKLRFGRRAGIVLELSDGSVRGFGEASPLPGHSAESLEEVHAELAALASAPLLCPPPPAPPGGDDEDSSANLAGWLTWLAEHVWTLKTPSGRFAGETALLDYFAQRRGVPLWQLMTSRPTASRLRCSQVIDPLGADALEQIARALGDGITTVKLKLGRDFERELDRVRSVRARWPEPVLALRLDVNQAWARAEVEPRLERLAPYAPEFVEEPCAELAGLGRVPVPLALDESLVGVTPNREFIEARPDVSALVLKPMLLGGLAPCLEWAGIAREAGKRVVVSHLFDGSLALAASAQLACAIQSPAVAAGLGPHAGLSAWRTMSAPPASVGLAHLEPPDGPGLGARWDRRLSVAAAAREAPDRVALTIGARELNFRELALGVDRVVRWLESSGAAARARASARPIAFVARPELGPLCLSYACLELGLTILPLHPRSSEEARARLVSELAPALVVDAMLLGRLEELLAEQPGDPTNEALAEPRPEPDPEGDLAWLPTSGSTRTPRIVRLSRRAFLAAADASALRLGWRSDDRWLLSLPFAHVGGLSVLTRCLIARRGVVIGTAGDPARWRAQLAAHRVTLLSLVPTQLARLLEDTDFELPNSVRAILLGGARAPRALVACARARGLPILRTYGLTEACSQVATERLAAQGPPRAGHPGAAQSTEGAGPGYAGAILPGVDVRLGPEGGLLIRGEQMLSGYVNLDEPCDADGWFSTSDFGTLAGGELHVLGRRDLMIISGGENVSPEALEAAIGERPEVREACVVGVPDPEWGQRVVALLEVVGHASVESIDAWCRTRLGAQERPRGWHVVERLPRLLSGKLDRGAAQALAETLEGHSTSRA